MPSGKNKWKEDTKSSSGSSYTEVRRGNPKPVFGRPLSEVGNPIIPTVVKDCIEYLSRPNNITEEGILRQSGSKSTIDKLKSEYDEGKDVNLNQIDPHAVGSLLKSYFRELPEPIIPSWINEEMGAVIAQQSDPLITANISSDLLFDSIKMELSDLLRKLPEPNFQIIRELVKFLVLIVQNSNKNKMNVSNVLTCLTPSLRITPGVIKFCMEDYDFFFFSDT